MDYLMILRCAYYAIFSAIGSAGIVCLIMARKTNREIDRKIEEYKQSVYERIANDIHSEWIYDEQIDMFRCDFCGETTARNIFPFCPWCGADMRGDEI